MITRAQPAKWIKSWFLTLTKHEVTNQPNLHVKWEIICYCHEILWLVNQYYLFTWQRRRSMSFVKKSSFINKYYLQCFAHKYAIATQTKRFITKNCVFSIYKRYSYYNFCNHFYKHITCETCTVLDFNKNNSFRPISTYLVQRILNEGYYKASEQYRGTNRLISIACAGLAFVLVNCSQNMKGEFRNLIE